jgi:hypothetical protein
LYYIIGYSILNQTKRQGQDLEAEKLARQKVIIGSKYQSAEKAVKWLKTNIGGQGDKEKFYQKFVIDSLYPVHMYGEMIELIQKGATEEELQQILKEAEVEGLKNKIVNEAQRVKVYEAINLGVEGDSLEQTRKYVEDDYIYPIEVKALMSNEKYDPTVGTKPYIAELKGEVSNLDIVIKSSQADEKTAISESLEIFSEKEDKIPKVVSQFFKKTIELDEVSWEKLGKLTGSWKRFITKTKSLSDDRRDKAIEIFQLSKKTAELNKFLDNKVTGLDWIPPLDLLDGEIMSVSKSLGIVMLNIGRRDGLRLHQRFDVLKVKGDVIQRKIARVQVTKLLHDISVGRIIERLSEDPIIASDKVADSNEDNPFDRKISPTYAMRGQFFSGLSTAFIRHLIRISGGEINDKITKDTKYAVFGKNPDKDSIALCKRVGVRVIKERNLTEHLGFTKKEIQELKKVEWY